MIIHDDFLNPKAQYDKFEEDEDLENNQDPNPNVEN
jgi:hypothetical protein